MQNKGLFCIKKSYNVTETFDYVTLSKKRAFAKHFFFHFNKRLLLSYMK